MVGVAVGSTEFSVDSNNTSEMEGGAVVSGDIAGDAICAAANKIIPNTPMINMMVKIKSRDKYFFERIVAWEEGDLSCLVLAWRCSGDNCSVLRSL